MKRTIATILALLLALTAFAGNTVVLPAGGQSSVKLKFCTPWIVKVHYSFDGTFSEEPPTPAVVSDEMDPMEIRVDEDDSQYEIFTGPLRVTIEKDPFRIKVYNLYQKLIVADVPDGYVRDGNVVSCTKVFPKDEHIFGLGEKGGPLERRGGTFTMWNSDKPCYCIDEDPLYKSFPFFLSSKNYGIFFDNSWKTHFDFSGKDSYTFSAEGGDLIYYIISGEGYKDIIKQYIRLTGQPVMPPKWALGFSQCRGDYTREKQALEVAAKFRELRIPCDVIYQDIGWTEYLQNFKWRPRNYSDPKGMLKKLSEQGFHVIVSQDPVISQPNKAQWKEADQLGMFAKDIRTGESYDMPWPWGGRCGVVDFTNPAAASWWGDLQQQVIDDGVAGFWTDMGEPAWSNEEEPDRLNMMHYAGPHAKIHNVYGLYWDRVVTTEFEKRNPDKRLFQMTRGAFSGVQRYAFSWTGDSGSESGKMVDSWENFAYQIPMMLSAGLCGMPFITGDITGYCGKIDDYDAATELYIRWMQFGLFTPLSRAHHDGNTAVEPWMFGEKGIECARKAIELKYTLMPYIYDCAREAYESGVPLMRAMFLEFPYDKECLNADFQFMFGPNLLVAPVVKKGAVTRRLYLPEGKWYDWYTGECLEGGRYIETPAPLDKIPLFVKGGSMIPMSPVMQYTGENPDAPVYIDIWPYEGSKSWFSLYEDDGESLGYRRGCYARTTYSYSMKDGVCNVESGDRVVYHDYEGCNAEKKIVYRIHGNPKSVTINGQKAKKNKDYIKTI